MAEEVIRQTEHGRMVGYRESESDRRERERRAQADAERALRLTRGQARTLSRVKRAGRRRASSNGA